MRELTKREKQRIRKLVTNSCANYCEEYVCLPLDCDCYMFGIAFNTSKLCRYFENAVLPLDAELYSVFNHLPTRACKQCGKRFAAAGKQLYCSEQCAANARREQTARRVRKHREKKASV